MRSVEIFVLGLIIFVVILLIAELFGATICFGLKKQKKNDELFYKKYPIGKKLKYMNKTITIKQNSEFIAGIGKIPCIYANYINNYGEICEIYFQGNDLNLFKE